MGAGSSKPRARTDKLPKSMALPTLQLRGNLQQHKLQLGCTVLSRSFLNASTEAAAGGTAYALTASASGHAGTPKDSKAPNPQDCLLPAEASKEQWLQWPDMPAEARLRIYILPCKQDAGGLHVLVQAASQHQFTWRPSAGHHNSILQHMELVQITGDADIQLGPYTASLQFVPGPQQCLDASCISAARHCAHGSSSVAAKEPKRESISNASKHSGSFIHELQGQVAGKSTLMFSTDQADRTWVANKSMRPSQEYSRSGNSLEQQQAGPSSTPTGASGAFTDTMPHVSDGFQVHHHTPHGRSNMQEAAKQAFARQQWHKQNSVPERVVKRSFESQPGPSGHHSLEVSSSPQKAASALPTCTWHHLEPPTIKEGHSHALS